MGMKLFFVAAVMFFSLVPSAFSMSCTDHKAGTEVSGEVAKAAPVAVNVGNTICPVSGEAIIEEAKATYEYEGKVYNFCCLACIDEFKKDPQSYIAKMQSQDSPQSYPPVDSMTAPTKPAQTR